MSPSPESEIEALARDLPFTIGVCAERLDAPAPRIAWNADEVFPAASVLKIAIALEVLSGGLDLDARVTLRDDDKVTGSGVLAHLDAGATVSIRDLLFLALAISDNTAANVLLARAGGPEPVNARLASLGLRSTCIDGRIFVPGEDGERSPTTPADLVRLVVHVRAACPPLFALLAKTQTASTIGRGLPDARFDPDPPIRLHHKTGSIVGVVNDAGVVVTPRATYAIALMSNGVPDTRPNHDNVARLALGRASAAIWRAFARQD